MPSPPRPTARGALDLARIAQYSIPTHLALPWLLWGLAVLSPDAPVWFFAGVHALFPGVLLVTYRRWKGHGVDVALLIGLNHVATLVSGAVAGMVASGW